MSENLQVRTLLVQMRYLRECLFQIISPNVMSVFNIIEDSQQQNTKIYGVFQFLQSLLKIVSSYLNKKITATIPDLKTEGSDERWYKLPIFMRDY